MRTFEGMFGTESIQSCFFCGCQKEDDLYLPNVAIAFGTGGYDYSFCQKCLETKSAYEFWNQLCKKVLSCELPLRIKGYQENEDGKAMD